MLLSILFSNIWFEKTIPLPDLHAVFNGNSDTPFLLHSYPTNVIEGLQNLSLYFYIELFNYFVALLAGVAVFVVLPGHMLYRYRTSLIVRRMKRSYASFLKFSSILSCRITNVIDSLPMYARKPIVLLCEFFDILHPLRKLTTCRSPFHPSVQHSHPCLHIFFVLLCSVRMPFF